MGLPELSLIYAAFDQKPTIHTGGRRIVELYAIGWSDQKIDDRERIERTLTAIRNDGRFEKHGDFWIDMTMVVAPNDANSNKLSFHARGRDLELDGLPSYVVPSVLRSKSKRP